MGAQSIAIWDARMRPDDHGRGLTVRVIAGTEQEAREKAARMAYAPLRSVARVTLVRAF